VPEVVKPKDLAGPNCRSGWSVRRSWAVHGPAPAHRLGLSGTRIIRRRSARAVRGL